jgi:hypothetical protein
VPPPFELWAADNGYDLAPAVMPDALRTYADRHTQEAFNVWNAGVSNLARSITESTLETEPLRERIKHAAES